MKPFLSLVTLVVALLNVNTANAGFIYHFVDSTHSQTIAKLELDTNVGQLTHDNFLSFHFTQFGDDIFGLGQADLSSKFHRTANGGFQDNGEGKLLNSGSNLVFISTPFRNFPYEGPEADFITLYFHPVSRGTTIEFSSRDTNRFYASVDGEWVSATSVNEPTTVALFSLVLGLVVARRTRRS